MAATTQIVPEFSFPYVETHVSDYTEVVDDNASDTSIDPAVGYILAFVSDKGIDNRFVLKRSQKDFIRTFGTPSFKKYGQPIMQAYNLLATGNTKVWCIRCMPDDATRAHAIASLYYKIDPKDGTPASKRKFRIKYTSRFEDPKKEGSTKIISKEDLQAVRKKLDGAKNEKGVYVDGEGYTQVPGIIIFSANGRGKGGNDYAVRIANNIYYEKEYGIKLMGFEILTSDKGLVKEETYMGSLVTSVKYDTATFINDVLIETDDGVASVDVDVDEDQIEEVYTQYIEFCKEQHTLLGEELEQKKVDNEITDAMLAGIEKVPEEKRDVFQEILEIEDLYEKSSDTNLPDLDGFDPIFGLKVGSVDNTLPFLYFPEKLTDEINTSADDYVAADYTSSDIVAFDDVRGVRLYGGTNGAYDNPGTKTVINAAGESEVVQLTMQDIVNEMYKRAWNGDLDKRILTAKRIACGALFDANYDFDVKCEMAKLALARQDGLLYLDTGIRPSLGNDELESMVSQYSGFASKIISKNIHHYYTKDPITKKRIPVTITYFLSDEFWKHKMNNGLYIPFVKENCQLSGHVKNSLCPTVEDYETTLKQKLNLYRFNYFETVEDNVYQRATQNTSQEENSDLLEESNVHLLYEAKRIIEADINKRLYRFNEEDERTRFTTFEKEKFRDWNERYVKSIDIKFKANKWELERSIIHCYVEIVFRGIYKRGIVEIDINKRSYAEVEE